MDARPVLAAAAIASATALVPAAAPAQAAAPAYVALDDSNSSGTGARSQPAWLSNC